MLRVLGRLLRQGHPPAIVGTNTVWRDEPEVVEKQRFGKAGGIVVRKRLWDGVEKVCFAHFIMPQNQSECKHLEPLCVMKLI